VDKNQIVMKKRHRKSVSQLPKTRLTTAILIKNEKIKPCQIFSNVFMVPFYNNKPCFKPDLVTDHLVVLPRDTLQHDTRPERLRTKLNASPAYFHREPSAI
jgi:hypothetical protein